MKVLRSALRAHEQDTPVQLDLKEGILSSRRHPKAWQLLLELLGRADGPPCKVAGGAVEAGSSPENPKVVQMHIGGYCFMQGLKLVGSQLPESTEEHLALLHVTGGLILSDSELDFQPKCNSSGGSTRAGDTTCSITTGMRPFKGSKHSSSPAANAQAPVTGSCLRVGRKQRCWDATGLFPRPHQAPSRYVCMRVCGKVSVDTSEQPSWDSFETHPQYGATSMFAPVCSAQAADRGTCMVMRRGSLSAACLRDHPLVAITKQASIGFEGMALMSLWSGHKPGLVRTGIKVHSGAKLSMQNCTLSLAQPASKVQGSEGQGAATRMKGQSSETAISLESSASADLSGCSIAWAKVAASVGSQLKAEGCTLAGGPGPALLVSPQSCQATLEDCRIRSTGAAAMVSVGNSVT